MDDMGLGAIVIFIIIIFTILPFLIFISIIGTILSKNKNINNWSNKSDDMLKGKETFTQEEIHAHDGIDTEKFDVTQNAVHEHDGFDVEGPISYK